MICNRSRNEDYESEIMAHTVIQTHRYLHNILKGIIAESESRINFLLENLHHLFKLLQLNMQVYVFLVRAQISNCSNKRFKFPE